MRRFSTSTKLRSSTFFAVDFYNQKVVAKGKVVADVFDLELHKAMQHDISRKNFTKLLGFQGDERLESLLGPIFGHYSQLKFDELPLGFEEKQKLFDPEYLPTRQEFLTMFRLEFDGGKLVLLLPFFLRGIMQKRTTLDGCPKSRTYC